MNAEFENLDEVESVLEELIRQGRVQKTTNDEGQTVYRLVLS